MRPELLKVAGARLFLHRVAASVPAAARAMAITSTQSKATRWRTSTPGCPRSCPALQDVPQLQDVNSDQQDKGLEVDLNIDRPTASKLGLNTTQIDNALYDAFGQRQISTIYKDKNQYYVVMEVAPQYWQSPDTLRDIFISTSGANVTGSQSTAAAAGAFVIGNGASSAGSAAAAPSGTAGISNSTTSSTSSQTSLSGTGTAATADANADALRNQQLNSVAIGARGGASTGSSVSTSVETMVPLSAFATYGPGTTPLAVNHQGVFVATTFSFGLPAGVSMDQALTAIRNTMAKIDVPITVHGETAGTASCFRSRSPTCRSCCWRRS